MKKAVVIYNTESPFKKEEIARVADEDTRDSAKLVACTLEELGYKTELVEIEPDEEARVKKLRTDVVFNLVEWSGCDSWRGIKVVEHLEKMGAVFTGGTSENYRWGSDKIEMKTMFARIGLATATWGVYDGMELRLPEGIRYPVILKPATEHCSIGLTEDSVVNDLAAVWERARSMWLKFEQPILIEEFIAGREYQVFVLEKHGKPWVLPPCETVYLPGGGLPLVTFEENWLQDEKSKKIERIVAADINDSGTRQMMQLAEKAFVRMGCRGYVRLDIREREGLPYVLEINVNPGLGWDEEEDVTVSARAAGLTFPDVVETIVKAAEDRRGKETYDTIKI